jgi:molecular chaperone GrpE
MTHDPTTNAPQAVESAEAASIGSSAEAELPEAELPQAPPGAPEGHDGAPSPDPEPEGVSIDGEPAVDGEPAAEREPAAGDETELAVYLEQLTAKAQKADEYLTLAQRTKADFENFRKRSAREAAAAQERGAVKLAVSLLPAIDNLDRALAHAESPGTGENGTASLVAGLRHVHAEVIAALGRVGIEPYSPEGQQFDPQYHEAVAQQPTGGAQPGTVVEVFQRGYRLGENVLRPARVVVAG